MRKTTISVPIYITLPKKTMEDKKYGLNMNSYRNWNFHLSNTLKKEFKRIIAPQLKNKRFDYPTIEYCLYYPDKRSRDKMNFASIISKFFLDALVECGCILDDNDYFIGREIAEIPQIDKENPRCDIILTEL